MASNGFNFNISGIVRKTGIIPFDALEISQALQDEIREETYRTAYDFVVNVTSASPVDTGHFLHNWRIRLDGKAGTTEVLKGKDKTGRRTSSDARRALAAARKRNPFKAVFVQNNVDYGIYLNAGWSQQAEAGFVEAALAEAARPENTRIEI